DWPAENGNGHQGRAAHGIDVTDGIGCGDPAKVEGVIDNRHKEIRSADNPGLLIQTKHRRIIATGIASPEPLKLRPRRAHGKNLIKHLGCNFAAAASTVAVFG